jgi:hypothetical protein
MPTVFASVSATIILFFFATMGLAYGHVFSIEQHMIWGFFVATLIVLLQCLIFGFFIGSGKSIKRVVADNDLEPHWVQKTKHYKNKCYPALMLAIVISAAAAILGGGAASGAVPIWVHEILVWLALAANLRSLWISYRVVIENVNAIHLINAEVQTRKTEGRAPDLSKPVEVIVNRPPPSEASKYYFLAIVAWVPYLYMRFSLSSRDFPFWPFLGLSGVLVFWGLWENRKAFKG